MVRSSKKLVLYSPKPYDDRRGPPTSTHLLPLSLLTIAAWPEREGFEVVLVDGNLFSEDEAHARVVAACEGALLYATTGILGYQVADGYRCTRAVKRHFPDLPAFIGGWFASALPELQLETGLYDAVALGQGELTFMELVRAVESGEPLDGVAGLALRRDGKTVRTDPRPVAGWDRLLTPPWHLLDWESYRRAQLAPGQPYAMEAIPVPPGLRGRPVTAISYFSSYGCPLPCTFCCSPETTGLRWKALPAERVLDDLEELKARWGFDVVHFFDANWGVAEKRVRALAEGLIERELDLSYYAYMQAESLVRYRPETLDLMADSGLYLALIGAETGDGETMQRIGKATSEGANLRAACELDRRGIALQASYLIGFPDETEASMLATIDQCRAMAGSHPFAAPIVWLYQPIPGAAMYDEALAAGFVPPRTLDEWGEFFDYRAEGFWPGRLTPRVRRMHRLYGHFTNLANGLARGRLGFWERRARRRLEDAAGFARDWPLGALEAKGFDLLWKLERRVRPRPAGYERGWRAGVERRGTEHARTRPEDATRLRGQGAVR